MTHGDGEAARLSEGGTRREHAWSAGLLRLSEELEAFTARLLDAQRALDAPATPQPPPPRRAPPRADPPRRGLTTTSLRDRLDATERLVAHLEDERRRDGAARVLALTDAAHRLEHVQQVIELSQRRLASLADPSISVTDEEPPTAPSPSPSPAPPSGSPSGDGPAERAHLRVQELEVRMSEWEQEVTRQAELLERVAHSCQELEADLATRDEIELHIATLIERLSRSIARVPLR